METMKLKLRHILPLCAMLLIASCVADIEPYAQGWLVVESPTRDTTLTRTGETQEIDYLVSVMRGDVTVFPAVRYSSLGGKSIPLSVYEGYTLQAESCNKTEAESQPSLYGQPRYAGTETFGIKADEPTSVKVKCAMANAAFQVVEDASFYYTSYQVVATVGNRTLNFTSEDQMGYFNVDDNSDTATLTYTVTATDAYGHTGSGSGTVTLRKKTLSRLHLKATDLGYINLEISYDDTFTPITTQIVVDPNP